MKTFWSYTVYTWKESTINFVKKYQSTSGYVALSLETYKSGVVESDPELYPKV